MCFLTLLLPYCVSTGKSLHPPAFLGKGGSFGLLCFLPLSHLRIWNFLQSKPLPSPMVQVPPPPPRMGTLEQLELRGIAVQLLKEQNQCKISACSSSFVASKQQTTTLPPSPLCNVTPGSPPSPWSMGLTGSD